MRGRTSAVRARTQARSIPGRETMRARSFVLLVAVAAAGLLPARASVGCPADYQPFAAFPGAQLTRTDYLSKDGVAYAMYRGFVPSFDGVPMSVDVTVP